MLFKMCASYTESESLFLIYEVPNLLLIPNFQILAGLSNVGMFTRRTCHFANPTFCVLIFGSGALNFKISHSVRIIECSISTGFSKHISNVGISGLQNVSHVHVHVLCCCVG